MATFCLLHGAWHDGSCSHEVAGELRACGHAVVAPDLPLHDPEAGYATRLAPAAERLQGVEGAVVIVGHSLGSDYASVLATFEPAWIRLMAPSCSASSRSSCRAATSPMLEDPHGLTPVLDGLAPRS